MGRRRGRREFVIPSLYPHPPFCFSSDRLELGQSFATALRNATHFKTSQHHVTHPSKVLRLFAGGEATLLLTSLCRDEPFATYSEKVSRAHYFCRS